MFIFYLLPLVALASGQGTLLAIESLIEPLYEVYDKNVIAAAAAELSNPADYPAHYSPKNGEEFDFIVVGAGSAGNVVANRLSENNKWKVLLLEAGDYPIKSIEVPALPATYVNTDIDWAYRTEPDGESCLGMTNASCSYPRGKVLGGSSAFNYMVYVRGNQRDYDRWDVEGCTDWGYKSVLPYFKKSEDMRVNSTEFSSEYHGHGGYLKVEAYHAFANEKFYEGIVSGFKEMNYQTGQDCNGVNQTGFQSTLGTLEDGRRCSTAKAFLRPIKQRQNFKLSLKSHVTKVLINDNNHASGVTFVDKDGKTVTVNARREVVVSAGAFGSPQLLMLSGVGPKSHLEEFGIEVKSDLPVGENLQDHPLLSGLVLASPQTDLAVPQNEDIYNFLMKKPSTYSNIKSVAYTGYVPTTNTSDVNWPECQLIMLSFPQNTSAGFDAWLTNTVGLRSDIQQQVRDLNVENYITYPFCSFLRPEGRGKVLLRSADPNDHPRIITGYFSNEKDFEKMLGFYDVIERLVQTKGMQDMGAQLHEIRVPECEDLEFASKEYRMCSLRHLTSTTFHHSGSCKMGAESDSKTVVDPRLRVKGVTGLRVCDASIMPHVVSGNTNAATIMVGERCSDLIKQDWELLQPDSILV